MINPNKVGHLFFGLGIMAYGMHQLVIQDFRPQIVAGFPAWAHTLVLLPILTGVVMVLVGLFISGILPVKKKLQKNISLYLGFYFLTLIVLSHIPYLLFVYPHKLSHLGSWGDVLKTLAFTGGSFVMAASFGDAPVPPHKNLSFGSLPQKLLLLGRIFYCTTIILFGCNHFAYDLSGMVPQWLGMSAFWAYFGGAALIAAGTAILLKIFLKPVALLLALMLFLWFVLLHTPNAIADPYINRGNRVVSAFDALLFCGTALLLSQTGKRPDRGTGQTVVKKNATTRPRLRV